MEIDKEEFKKKYPKIAKEMEKDSSRKKINCVKNNIDSNKNENYEEFRGYNPSVIDFIRRCNTFKEADSIISYLEKRGEISPEYSKRIRVQIKDKGIRSFGSKKRINYYFNKAKKKY
jgi:hypothetical protein